MCGRFTMMLMPNEMIEAFDLEAMSMEWVPRYNVAPSQPVAVVTDPHTRRLDFMQWGLVPSWARDISIGNKLINARAETINEKPSFRTAFQRRRCLILADGFYEWSKANKSKGITAEPYLFQLKGGAPFAFAGLWENWESSEGDVLKSCTIITTRANGLVAQVHERMPVILTPENAWNWLEAKPASQLLGMLQPFSAEKMIMQSVSRLVNDPRREGPEIIQASFLSS